MINFQDLLAQKLAEREQKERDHKVYYASELGYCALKIFFSITQPLEVDTRVLQIFKVGDLVHEYLQNIVQERYPDAQAEVPIRQEVDEVRHVEIHGRIDLLHDGVPYEFKTTSRPPSAPQPHHVVQLNTYLRMLDQDIGYLVYVEKNTMSIAQFKIRRDDCLYDLTIAKTIAVHDAVERYNDGDDSWGELLAPHVARDQCKWCRFKEICPLARGEWL